MNKKCRKCEIKKDISEFYVHKKMLDGHLNICIDCTKERIMIHRKNNIERIRRYDRNRGLLEERREQNRKYYKSKKGKESSDKAKKNWEIKNKEKRNANNILNNAVRDGKIKKEPCIICGDTELIHGHHENYDRPLDVIWFCNKHHSKFHRQKRNILRINKYIESLDSKQYA